jgi:hypothetical protein
MNRIVNGSECNLCKSSTSLGIHVVTTRRRVLVTVCRST